MKIAIMGAGSIGSYYGAKLQQGGSDVTFIARGDHLRAIQRNGLIVEDTRKWLLSDAKATDNPSTIGPVDVVLFCVKLRDTETAARAIKPIVKKETAVISLQNGVQKDDMLAPIIGREVLLGGAAYISVVLERPGMIRKIGQLERLAFGEYDNSRSPRVKAFLSACKAAGINADIPSDIVLELWQKFVFLTGTSSLTASMRSTIGPIRAHPLTRQFGLDLMKEVVAVGRAHGIPLAPDFAENRLAAMDQLAPEMQASMAIDLSQGKSLELPWLTGAVVDLGKKIGVPTPCCRAVRDILALYVDGRQLKAYVG
jgi:2-dehydropantoate 2-reductase